MDTSNIIASISALGSLLAIFISIVANKHARESANAAKESNRVAQAALELEGKRFSHESSEARQREKDSLIETGKGFLLKEGRRGFKRWFHGYPVIFDREDWFEIIRAAGASKGFHFKTAEEFKMFAKQFQIELPNQGGKNGGA